MTIVVGFISEKGGVGKTTACYHIAIALVRVHGKKVLVIDADYQRGGITGRFFPSMIEKFGKEDVPGTTLFHKFQQLYSAAKRDTEIDIKKTKIDGLDLIPADPRLSMVSTDKLPSTNNIRSNNLALLEHLKVIAYTLGPLKEAYDYVLIDSHPEVSDVLRAIIFAADYCVSPVKLDRQSSIGVATVIGEIQNVNEDMDVIQQSLGLENNYTSTKFAGAIGMMAREYGGELKQTERNEYARLLRTGKIFKNYVTEGDGLRQAAAARQSVYSIGGANAEKQSAQFWALTREFVDVCKPLT